MSEQLGFGNLEVKSGELVAPGWNWAIIDNSAIFDRKAAHERIGRAMRVDNSPLPLGPSQLMLAYVKVQFLN